MSTDTSWIMKSFANGPSRGSHREALRQPHGLGARQGPRPSGQELQQSLALLSGKLAGYAENLSPARLHLGPDSGPGKELGRPCSLRSHRGPLQASRLGAWEPEGLLLRMRWVSAIHQEQPPGTHGTLLSQHSVALSLPLLGGLEIGRRDGEQGSQITQLFSLRDVAVGRPDG